MELSMKRYKRGKYSYKLQFQSGAVKTISSGDWQELENYILEKDKKLWVKQ